MRSLPGALYAGLSSSATRKNLLKMANKNQVPKRAGPSPTDRLRESALRLRGISVLHPLAGAHKQGVGEAHLPRVFWAREQEVDVFRMTDKKIVNNGETRDEAFFGTAEPATALCGADKKKTRTSCKYM